MKQAKGQTVRLLDVFFIGPLMAYGGMKLSDKHPVMGGTLVGLGALTIAYNGRNYIAVKQGERSG